MKSNNNPVNYTTAPMSGLNSDLDKVVKLRAVKVCLVSDCSGLSEWIFMSRTDQPSSERLFV